ncbi:MAG: methylmalonyl-CoA epimerase [Planctomycetota bacterium]|nr:methylmalonyl-CoA epimerase [Planctomycetota bacterium]
MDSLKLDHIGIAVRSIEQVIPLWRDTLNAKLGDRETIPSQQVEVLFLETGETRTELLEPTSPDSAVSRFIEKRGEGLHHIAYQVEDLTATMKQLISAGSKLIYPEPRPGSHSTLINFIHPSSTGGVLIELVEYPAGCDSSHRKEEPNS